MTKKIIVNVLKVILLIFLLLSVLPYAMGKINTDEFDLSMLYSNSEIIDINGYQIHYREWLPESSEKGCVMLVHGLGGSTFSWRHVVKELTQAGYFVIAVDLPGFGFSSREQGFNHSQENRAQYLWEIIDFVEENYSINHQWNLIGHSMGGGTVTAMAVLNSEKTKRVILANGALFSTNPSISKILVSYPPVRRWAELLLNRVYFEPDKLSDVLESAYGRKPTEEETKGYLDPLKLEGTVRTLLDIVKTSSNISKQEFSEIEVPFYAIWGEQDSWVDINNMYILKELKPGLKTYVIKDAGHCPMETHPNEFNIMLMEIINES